MRRESLLIDTDALLAARSLSFLVTVKSYAKQCGVFVIGEYAARHELCPIEKEIRALEAAGIIVIRSVERRTPADAKYRELVRGGTDKGEAEAIAWACTVPVDQRPIFISVDVDARKKAKANGVRAGDVMDLVVLLIRDGSVTLADARTKLAPWLDPEQQRGRPADLHPFDFDQAFKRRSALLTDLR